MTIKKVGHTWKKKDVTLWKNSKLGKIVYTWKKSRTWKIGSHLEKKGHTCKNGSHLEKLLTFGKPLEKRDYTYRKVSRWGINLFRKGKKKRRKHLITKTYNLAYPSKLKRILCWHYEKVRYTFLCLWNNELCSTHIKLSKRQFLLPVT